LLWRTYADFTEIQAVVLDVFGGHLAFGRIAVAGRGWRSGLVVRSAAVFMRPLAQGVMETGATADTAEFALLGDDIGLVVRAGLSGMESILVLLLVGHEFRTYDKAC
jgi:hypothetical protein